MPILTQNSKVLTAAGKVLIREPSPLDLPNLKLYLSATRMPQYADGTAMPSFVDFSSSNLTATQTTTSLQPLFKTNQFGTNAGINFDGIDDALNLPSGSGNILKNVSEFTFQYLGKRSGTSTTQRGVYLGQQTSGSFRLLFQFSFSGIVQCNIITVDGGTPISLVASTNDLNVHLVQVTMNTDYKVYMYLDGMLVANGIATSLTPFTNVTGINNSIGYINQASPAFGDALINGISINTSYSDNTTIQAQYRGYLQRGYL